MAESWSNLDITSVLNAGEFYVREAPNDSESSQNFNEFDKCLNDHFWERYENGFLSRIGAFKPQQPVITLYQEKWCRGIVREKRPSKERCDYQLFLSDYGVFVTLPESKIYALPSSSFSAEPDFAKRVKLGHIVPISMASKLVGCQLIITPDERFRWDASATVFVKNIKRLSSLNQFTCEKEVDGSYVGEFIVCVTPKLKRFLQEKRPNHIFKSHENLADLLVLFEFGKRRDELLPVPNPSNSKTLGLPSSNDKRSDSGSGSSNKSSASSSSSDKEETQKGKLPVLKNLLTSRKEFYKSPKTPDSEEDLWSPFTRKFNALNHSAYQRLTDASPIAVLRNRNDSNVVHNDFCELPEPRFRFPSTNILSRRIAGDNTEINSDPEDAAKPKYQGKNVRLCAPENFGDFWASRSLDITRLIRVYNHGVLATSKNEIMTNLWDLKSIANSSVYDSLEARKFLPSDLQLVMWPTVIRGRSCVAIDRNKGVGKTMGYIAPLMSQILDTHETLSSLKHKETGPLAIVVCSTSVRVVDVAEEMEKLIGETEIKIVTMYAGCSPDVEKHTHFRLSVGAHVLVTTMQCLERHGITSVVPAVKDLSRYISLARCFHLVYDDLEDIMKMSSKKPITLLEMWMETITPCHQLPKQFVVTANGWSQEIQELMPLIDDLQPSIIISSALDAVIHSSLKTKTHFITEENMHFQTVIDVVSQNRKKKILIFVEDSSQAAYMQKLLKTIAVIVDYIGSDYHYAIAEVLCSWYGDSSAVCLVAADCVEAVLDHDLRDADIVIHLTPPRSCHDFSHRYSFMLDKFPHAGDSEITCSAHVILSEDIISACPRLVNELQSLKAEMDCSVEHVHQRTMEAIEEKKKTRALCGLWKSFGRCESFCCSFRHVPDADDVHGHLPLSGEITFDIVTIVSPIRFTIKIRQYKDPETSQIVSFDKYYNSMFSFLQWYFVDDSNKRVIHKPSVGMLCALKGSHSWVRGDILEIQADVKVIKCKVFLLDEGTCHLKSLNALYELPEECCTMPALVNEVFIGNVKPVDLSTEFTPYANQLITQKIKKTDPTCYKGRVVMSLENTIWLSPTLQITQIGTTTLKESLKNILLENDLGIEDKEHLQLLEDTRDRLFRKFDWTLNYESSFGKLVSKCPKVIRQTESDSSSNLFDSVGYEEEKVPSLPLRSPKKSRSNVLNLLKSLKPKRPQLPRYCRLPLQIKVLVEVSRIATPNEFFMVMLPTEDKMHQLRGEISKHIGSCVPLSDSSSSEIFLAPGHNAEYQRCKISLKGPVESECYFIDTGLLNTVCNNAILECPSCIVDFLEAQAIQCSLCVDFSQQVEHASFTMNLLIFAEPNWFVKAIHEEIVLGQPKYKVELFSSLDVSAYGVSAILMDAIKDLPTPRDQPSPTRTIKDFLSRYSSKASSVVGEETAFIPNKPYNPSIRPIPGRVHSQSKSSESDEVNSTAQPTVVPQRLSFGRGRPIEKPRIEVGSCIKSVSQNSPGRPFSNDVQTRINTFWSQTQTDLTIKFYVGYKAVFEHKVGKTWIYASLTVNNELFTVNEDLYANVDSVSLRVERNNKFMVLHLKKCVAGKWPRLLSETKPHPWLKMDQADMTSSDESLAYMPPPPLPTSERTESGREIHHRFLGGKPEVTTSCESLDSDGSSIYRHY